MAFKISIKTDVKTKIRFNGKEYGSAEEMPPEVREVYKRLMAEVDADGDGIPDVLQRRARADGRGQAQRAASDRSLPTRSVEFSLVGSSPHDVWVIIAAVILLAALGLLAYWGFVTSAQGATGDAHTISTPSVHAPSAWPPPPASMP